MKNIIFFSSLLILLAYFSCTSEKNIVQSVDFNKYLTTQYHQKAKIKLQSDLNFWQTKLAKSPQNFVYQQKLAGLQTQDFKLTGNIESLRECEQILKDLHQTYPNQVGILHSLVANSISRHAFVEAEKYAALAIELGEKRYVSSLLTIDVAMERGDLELAKNTLEILGNKSQFDFLIREMKLYDQEGRLDLAIKNMEQAAEIAQSSGNQQLINWSLSNLGDMYGHDGQIQKSYDTFLQALSHNPTDFHSLKGIAWIAFSYDKNVDKAKRILNFLKEVHPIPDYDLLLAEIAHFEDDNTLAAKYEQQFLEEATRTDYGNMYKRYIALLNKKPNHTLQIAEAEVVERPHPMAYELLAWSYLQNGEKVAALETLENHVLEKTEEPDALFHAGLILKENGKNWAAKEYLEAALEAEFELGPVAAAEIRGHLAVL